MPDIGTPPFPHCETALRVMDAQLKRIRSLRDCETGRESIVHYGFVILGVKSVRDECLQAWGDAELTALASEPPTPDRMRKQSEIREYLEQLEK